jgi:hypothetical protein
MSVGPDEVASLAGAVYVLQPVLHVDAVLPRELRSGMGRMHSTAVNRAHPADTAEQQHPGWGSGRVCGPGYVITILSSFYVATCRCW